MAESFLHYLWQMQYFDKRDLHTIDGEKIEIFNPGVYNDNAGPDFSNARIRIGSIDWVGSVEVHTQSSEWDHHHHEQDQAYDNVILHLVWQHDKEVARSDKTTMPTLELKGRVDTTLITTYRQLVSSSFSIPCQRSLSQVDNIVRISMLEKSLLHRLERKAEEVIGLFQLNNNDWEETLYQLMSRNFGFKINAEPFFQLSRQLPLKIIRKHADKQEQVEALLFGHAGFLDGAKGDEYYLHLKKEHQLLVQKYSLQQKKLARSQWRYLRMRPANFPSLRLAQWSAILHQRLHLFSLVIQADSVKALTELLSVNLSEYWLRHYQFTKSSKSKVHELGASSIENIVINTVIPTWVAYGKLNDDDHFVDRALSVLQDVTAEENKITKMWRDAGISAATSFDSQALIELYNNFCQRKNCLNCNIGAALIRPAK